MSDQDKDKQETGDETLRPEGMRALERERAKNAELTAKVAAMEKKAQEAADAELTEKEAAIKRAERAEAELAKSKAESERSKLAAKVAKDTGVPAHLITGETEADMVSSAEAQIEFAKNFDGPRSPEPDPTQGQDGGSNTNDTDALAVLGFGSE